MTPQIANQIQDAQCHGRQKYGKHPNNTAHDDQNSDDAWAHYIADHNERARLGTPMERRAHLIKVAGLAVSAVEALDRRIQK